MKSFEYMQPESIKSASKQLIKNNNSLPYAGGTDLLGLLKDEIYSPSQLINLKNIPDLDYIIDDGKDGIRIGALTKLSTIENNNIIKENFTVLFDSITELATPQLRNVGTIGGNICQRPRCFYFRDEYDCIRKGGDTCYAVTGNNKYHCIVGGDPCYIVHPSDTAVALLSLDAKIKIFTPKGEKIISIDDFFVLPSVDDTKENILNDGELLLEIIIPKSKKNINSKYIKVKERGTWDFALVSIAGTFELKNDVILNGKIAFGGVAPIPWQEKMVNDAIIGMKINKKNISSLSKLAFMKTDTLEMNTYKIPLARNLITKLFLETFKI